MNDTHEMGRRFGRAFSSKIRAEEAPSIYALRRSVSMAMAIRNGQDRMGVMSHWLARPRSSPDEWKTRRRF